MNGTARGMLTSTYYGTNPDALGVFGGAQKFALGATNLPSITSSNSGIGVSVTLGPPSAVAVCNIQNGSCATNNGSGVNVQTNADVNLAPASLNNAPASVSGVTVTQGTSSFTGNDTAFPTIQPTLSANCMVRVLSFLMPLRGVPSPAANDNQFAIEPRRLAA